MGAFMASGGFFGPEGNTSSGGVSYESLAGNITGFANRTTTTLALPQPSRRRLRAFVSTWE